MKLTAETKLLLVMGIFVLLGGGFLAISNKIGSGAEAGVPGQPGASPTPIPTPTMTRATFDELVKNARHVKDAPNAKFTVIEFADFQCPSCRRAYASASSRFGKDVPVRLVFYNFPLVRIHDRAMPAAVAAEAAGKQGKFWEMFDALFTGEDPHLLDADIDGKAKALGLDLAKFHKDQQDPALEQAVTADAKLAEDNQVIETPTFLIVSNSDKKMAPLVKVGAPQIAAAVPYLQGKMPAPLTAAAGPAAAPAGPAALPAGAAGPVGPPAPK